MWRNVIFDKYVFEKKCMSMTMPMFNNSMVYFEDADFLG